MKDGELWCKYTEASGGMKDGELRCKYTHIAEESRKRFGRLVALVYGRGVHASLSHVRGTDLVVMVWHTLSQ